MLFSYRYILIYFPKKSFQLYFRSVSAIKLSAQTKKHGEQWTTFLNRCVSWTYLLESYDTRIYSHKIGFTANIFTDISCRWGEVTPEMWKKNMFKIQLKERVHTHKYTHTHVSMAIFLRKSLLFKSSSEFICFPFKTI